MAHIGATTAWTSRIILGERTEVPDPPRWLAESYATFRKLLLQPGYPCYFGANAERRGELYYSYVCGEDIEHLTQTLSTFIELSTRRTTERNNLAVFFEPDTEERDHETYRARFWQYLQYLHDRGPPSGAARWDPDDPQWEFPFGGVQFFVVALCPTYRRRHSRNLGPGMVMLFQPRDVFVDDATGRPLGMAARVKVRERLLSWDDVPVHADLNVYGHPDNREWKQYFLPDGEQAETRACPLRVHTGATYESSAQATEPAAEPVSLSAEGGADGRVWR